MADTDKKSVPTTGLPADASGSQQPSVETHVPPQATGATAQFEFPPAGSLLYGMDAIRRSAEQFSLGVTHRVTMADFSAIVMAVIATYGHSSPIRARCNVPPSMLDTMSAAAANLASAVASSSAMRGSSGSSTEKTRRPATVKTGKVKTVVRKRSRTAPAGGTSKEKNVPPVEEDLTDLELQKARRVLLNKALRALKTKNEELQRAYTRAQIDEPAITEVINSLSLDAIKGRQKGVPVLSFLGLTSIDRLQKFNFEWTENEAFTALYEADLNAALATARAPMDFPPTKEVLARLRAEELPLSRSVVVAKMRAAFSAPRTDPEMAQVLIPALQQAAGDLLLQMKNARPGTGVVPLTLSKKGTSTRQRVYARLEMPASDSGPAAPTIYVAGNERLFTGKAGAPLFSASNVSKKEKAAVAAPPVAMPQKELPVAPEGKEAGDRNRDFPPLPPAERQDARGGVSHRGGTRGSRGGRGSGNTRSSRPPGNRGRSGKRDGLN